MRDASGAETLLLDPDTLPSEGAHYAIDWYAPAPDGRRIAVGVSQGGSEDSELRVYDLAEGKWLAERIDRAGLNEQLGWLPDGSGFFYNRLPPADANGYRERYNKSAVYLHKLGQPLERDAAVFGYGLRADMPLDIADIPNVRVAPGSRYAVLDLMHGDAVEHSYYIAPLDRIDGPATPWRRIVAPADQVAAAWQHGETLYLLSHRGAPRGKLLALDLARPEIGRARSVLPAGQAVLRDAAVARDALYVRANLGGVDQLLRLPHGGQPIRGKPARLALPVAGTLRMLSTDPERAGALVKLEGWVESPRIYAVAPRSGKLADTGLQAPSPVDFSAIEARRVMVRSHDGVEVPLSLVYPKALKRDGSNPTLLMGYGAYGITMEARFDAGRLAWLERGGVSAICHVRGGGEYGEDWHRAGYIQTKANTAKDFIACAEYLVKEGYTSPARLAGQGRSAGGITIGGAITARPELFTAANSGVGVSDMLRMEFTPNGPPNIAEFGTVTREADFRAMLSNSPYHRIKDGVAYPAVIVTTGANDPRVDAWMPAKLTARLQAASSSKRPVILRVDYDGGHGMGSTKSQQVAETADVWSFFLWRMGVEGFQPRD
ncbi:prolyl oligopeptidase family serine peptidase [Chitinimonas koreensis]|uniref:prolyl oligopeptidase family serine peptidase n=1 Tax=Chitinimonas koreensis TaxID=356302 RepID=UPI0016540C76|nr:prolyl oligopeptidase family serine peptidase [Chitinimonas koreensis]QNM95002.1 S9 family peptidase [Chitinimonas koreensis]